MADQDNYKTYVRETRTTEGSGAGMALLVGGLVVAVGFILWLGFGGSTPDTPPAAVPAVDSSTNVTIEPPAAAPAVPDSAAPGGTTGGIVDPEAAPVPADPAPAPVQD